MVCTCSVELHFAGNDVGPRVDSDGAATTTNDYTEVELVYCRDDYRESRTPLRRTVALTNSDVNISDFDVTAAVDSKADVITEQPEIESKYSC